MSFPCTGCGACCRRINKAVASIGSDASDPMSEFYFPYKWDQTGRCEKLLPDNSCSVYEDRPLICNIDKLHSFVDMPQNQFYALNIVFCNQMMDEDKMPQSFRIK